MNSYAPINEINITVLIFLSIAVIAIVYWFVKNRKHDPYGHIKKNKRYKNMHFLENPEMFHVIFRNRDYDVVQIHSASRIKEDSDEIIGFCGVFKWKDNEITSLDHDSYFKEMPVIGFEEFIDSSGTKCLDILVKEW